MTLSSCPISQVHPQWDISDSNWFDGFTFTCDQEDQSFATVNEDFFSPMITGDSLRSTLKTNPTQMSCPLKSVRRSRDITNSWIFPYLRRRCPNLTRTALIQLAKDIVKDVSNCSRLIPLSRSEKRTKFGVVMWMERNAPYVLGYLSMEGNGN
jgi:hypothetical protein